jgi:hypothetical protein
MLTREQILRVDDRKRAKVPVPEWAEEGQDPAEAFVYVRMISAGERARWEAGLEARKGDPAAPPATVVFAVLALCDEAGRPAFTEADIPALAGKSAAAIDRVVEAAIRLNKVSTADIETLEGESAASRSNGSSAASPGT